MGITMGISMGICMGISMGVPMCISMGITMDVSGYLCHDRIRFHDARDYPSPSPGSASAPRPFIPALDLAVDPG